MPEPQDLNGPMYQRLEDSYENLAAASPHTSFRNIDGDNVSAYPELDWGTYTCFRPSEKISRKHRDVMKKCGAIYEECGIVKNIVDLMSDFTCRGLTITHPQASRAKIYQKWADSVDLLQVVERFCNYCYSRGNIAVQRHYGTLTYTRNGKKIRTKGPVKYNFINPAIITVDDKGLGSFTGEFKYQIKLKQQ